MKWAYGVTTVPERRANYLQKTMMSLRSAGFGEPRLFVDGLKNSQAALFENEFNLPVTCRWPAVRSYGNWVLSLWELYLRDPHCDMYVIFQDDILTYPNLRQYLDRCTFPEEKGYYNLWTAPNNQELADKSSGGWFESNQRGQGALALAFNKEAMLLLMRQKHFVEKPQCQHRGWRTIDGGVISTMEQVGYKEFCHQPSLIQHIGMHSSMGNHGHALVKSMSFRGETFNALELLK